MEELKDVQRVDEMLHQVHLEQAQESTKSKPPLADASLRLSNIDSVTLRAVAKVMRDDMGRLRKALASRVLNRNQRTASGGMVHCLEHYAVHLEALALVIDGEASKMHPDAKLAGIVSE